MIPNDQILLFLNLGTGEIVIICLVILLLFGGKKIPELMRGMGKGVKSFKEGLNEVQTSSTSPSRTRRATRAAPTRTLSSNPPLLSSPQSWPTSS